MCVSELGFLLHPLKLYVLPSALAHYQTLAYLYFILQPSGLTQHLHREERFRV